MRTCCLALLVLSAGCGGDSGTETTLGPSAGVSFLDYSPRPFYKDMTELTVRLTTTGPAGSDPPGNTYVIWVESGKDKRDTDCYREFASDIGGPGESGKTYAQVIRMTTKVPTDSGGERRLHACFGRGRIVVEAGEPPQIMRTLPFRILPPRASN